ncbi:hypothetical protein Ciccas_012732 [Cichlidogyrus casuarinus]|uniref:G-protein coupled receptors family 1 profile domain-containing protein n=1 Tax=Cichlidogyrus casuarinus TaxID=1844966 RepID=A0ABD2PMJ6_9PLAT
MVDLLNNAISFFAVFETVVGVPGNILSAYLIITDSTTRITTRLFMVFLSIFDLAMVCVGPPKYFLQLHYNFTMTHYSEASCYGVNIMHSFVSDMAVYALCGVAVERFIVVAFPASSQRIITVKTTLISFAMLSFIFCTKNFSFNYSIFEYRNNSCLPRQGMDGLFYVDFVVFAVIPYLILLPCNLFIFVTLRKRRILLKNTINGSSDASTRAMRESMVMQIKQQNMKDNYQPKQEGSKRKKKKPENVVKVLMGLTFAHILFTLPATIIRLLILHGFTNETIDKVKSWLTLLIYTNNATTFFVYLITLSNFRKRVFSAFHFLNKSISLCGNKHDNDNAENFNKNHQNGNKTGADHNEITINKP